MFYGRTQSGSGGGGGWPFGMGGNAGQMNYDDTMLVFTRCLQLYRQVSNVGETITKLTAVSYGSNFEN